MVPATEVKVTCDCTPQKSSLPVTQVSAAQVPLKTPSLVSYPEPQRLKVMLLPLPTRLYHTPGAVLRAVIQVGVAASVVAALVEAAMVWLQLMEMAPVQRSLAGGGGGTQLVHCTVVVRQVFWVPQAAFVFQCAKSVPVKVLANVSGVVPNATTAPPEVPERMVIKSVATLLVNRRVWPFTALLMVEYSPAKEQVEMVTSEPLVLMVALPKAVVFVH